MLKGTCLKIAAILSCYLKSIAVPKMFGPDHIILDTLQGSSFDELEHTVSSRQTSLARAAALVDVGHVYP